MRKITMICRVFAELSAFDREVFGWPEVRRLKNRTIRELQQIIDILKDGADDRTIWELIYRGRRDDYDDIQFARNLYKEEHKEVVQ